MFLLALDCSTSRGSVAVGWRTGSEPPIISWQQEFPAGRGCGGKFFAALREAMDIIRDGGIDSRLEGILVGLGPGSYSGVRQAIAAANGLACATGVWLRGAPSALLFGSGKDAAARAWQAFLDQPPAWNLRERQEPYQIVGDARRGAFYYTAVRGDGTSVAAPELLENAAALAARLAERPDWPVRVVEATLPNVLLPDAMIDLPEASHLFFLHPAALQPPPLEPIYLRPVSVTLPKTVPLPVP